MIRAWQPGATAEAGMPGQRAQIDVSAAVALKPIEELVDVPGAG